MFLIDKERKNNQIQVSGRVLEGLKLVMEKTENTKKKSCSSN